MGGSISSLEVGEFVGIALGGEKINRQRLMEEGWVISPLWIHLPLLCLHPP